MTVAAEGCLHETGLWRRTKVGRTITGIQVSWWLLGFRRGEEEQLRVADPFLKKFKFRL